MNSINIIGNLVSDPILKNVGTNGTALCEFSIAENTKRGETNYVNYFSVKAWGKIADVIEKWFKKGNKIGITGRIDQERWQDNDGKTKSKVVITIERLDFLTPKSKDEPITEPMRGSQIPPDETKKWEDENPFSDEILF